MFQVVATFVCKTSAKTEGFLFKRESPKGVFQVLTFAHHTLPEVLSFQPVNFCLKSNLQNNLDIIFRSFPAKVPKQTLTILRSVN